MSQPRLEAIKNWTKRLKRDVIALCLASQDRRIPWTAKAVAGFVAAYALSPIDLIPDFIPVLGYLDDLVLVPAGILLAVRLIPEPLMAEFRAEAAKRNEKPSSRTGVITIVIIWIAVAAASLRYLL